MIITFKGVTQRIRDFSTESLKELLEELQHEVSIMLKMNDGRVECIAEIKEELENRGELDG